LTINYQHLLEPSSNVSKVHLVDSINSELKHQQLLQKEYGSNADQIEASFSKKKTNSNNNNEMDDGTTHKFQNAQFTEAIFCDACKKKIWFKSAYQCIYCGQVVHTKCHEKALNKTICQRFFSKDHTKYAEEPEGNSNVDLSDQFLMVQTPNDQIHKDTTDTDSIGKNHHRIAAQNLSSSKRYVSNLLSGIRNRKWLANNQLPTKYIENNHSNINNNNNNGIVSTKSDEIENNLNEDSSLVDDDEFKDIDVNASEDKFFGSELFDGLPNSERKIKFEETVSFFFFNNLKNRKF
jgi:hypothetical protein